MKILHIITGLGSGGAERSLYNLVTNDKKNEHIIFSLISGGFYEKPLKAHNIQLIYPSKEGVFSLIASYKKLRRHVLINNIDLIQSWMYHADLYGSILSILTGRSVVWNIRGSRPSIIHSKISTTLVYLINSLLSWFVPKKIVICSKHAIPTHKYFLFSVRKFVFIPNAISPDLKLNLNNKKTDNTFFNILVPARFSKQKGHKFLFKAMNVINLSQTKINFIFAGHGTKSEKFEKLLCKYQVDKKVDAMGEVKYMQNLYNASDLIILPSIYGEGFPNVLAEGLLFGIPSISTDIGDSREIIRGTGWLVKPRSSDELARSILEAYDEYEDKRGEWSARCQKAIKYSKEYSLEFFIEKYNEVWESCG